MSREFSRKVKAAAYERSDGLCEGMVAGEFPPPYRCNAPLARGVEYDHIVPYEYTQDSSLANCQCLCRLCHRLKTTDDVKWMRKAERVRDRASGALKTKSRPIPGSKASGVKKGFDGKVTRR